MSDQESCEESKAGSSDAEYQPGQSAEAGEMEENEQDEEKEAAHEEAGPKEKVEMAKACMASLQRMEP